MEAGAFLCQRWQTEGATIECHVVHIVSAQKCHMMHVREPLLIGTTGFRGLLAGSQLAIMLKEYTHTKERGEKWICSGMALRLTKFGQ